MDTQLDLLELLDRAVELDGEERRAFLDEIGERNPSLRAELEEILAGDDEGQSRFLAGRAVDAFGDLLADAEPNDGSGFVREHPETLGPFRVESVLGEGGMGCVYLARQTEPVTRTVAVKLIRSGFTTPEALARFAAERQAMARLSHPAVASMLAAGTTDDGFPYFAMEHVPGLPLLAFCDRERLDVDARLELFVKICGGVEHAHRKGILHRDLKPSNILVTSVDGEPLPKIIDFGIAKAVSGSLTDETVLTRFGIGTPAYMSPEAFATTDGGDDLDTRTDVYALGVILFRLLISEPPFDTQALGLPETVRRITEHEAPRPGDRFRGLDPEDQERVAEARRVGVDALARKLTGDLDWIVARALAPERDRRYGSAAELAADVRRHLHLEPVSVGPPSLAYRAGRLARRRPALTFGAVLAALALTLGTLGTAVGMVRARHEAERAVDEARKTREALREAEESTELLVHLFEVADPREAGGETLTARALPARGERWIERRLADRPLRRADLLLTLSEIYRRLGLPEDARRLEIEAEDLRRKHSVP